MSWISQGVQRPCALGSQMFSATYCRCTPSVLPCVNCLIRRGLPWIHQQHRIRETNLSVSSHLLVSNSSNFPSTCFPVAASTASNACQSNRPSLSEIFINVVCAEPATCSKCAFRADTSISYASCRSGGTTTGTTDQLANSHGVSCAIAPCKLNEKACSVASLISDANKRERMDFSAKSRNVAQ